MNVLKDEVAHLFLVLSVVLSVERTDFREIIIHLVVWDDIIQLYWPSLLTFWSSFPLNDQDTIWKGIISLDLNLEELKVDHEVFFLLV